MTFTVQLRDAWRVVRAKHLPHRWAVWTPLVAQERPLFSTKVKAIEWRQSLRAHRWVHDTVADRNPDFPW